MDGQENTKKESMSDRIVRHRLRIFARILIVLGVIAGVIAIFWVQQQRRTYHEYEVAATAKRDTSTNATSVLLGEDVLSYSNDGANCTNVKGESIWNETFEMQKPILAVCGTTAAIGDYDGGQIYVVNTEGSLGTINTNLPIRELAVSGDGVVAAVLDDKNVTWIYLYSAAGDTLAYFKTTMSQSGYPISVSISPNSTLVAVSYFQSDGGKVKSGIAFYNFGDVGQNAVDNYMSGYDYEDSVVPYVQFMNADEAFAVADNRLMFYQGSQKPVSKAETLLDTQVQSVYYNSQYVALITYDTTGTNKYMLNVYDTSGAIKLQKGFDLDYKNLVISGNYIYLYGDTQCVVYNLYGTQKFAGTMNQDISLLIPGQSINKMTIVSNNAISQITLK
jgi:hypothetical protein